jgi:predicted 2-oxoglutarate/Fe(II)-dependent dioxygenase YbiX
MQPTLLDSVHDIFTIPAVLSSDECAALVAYTEGKGYTDAPITTSFGFVMAPEVRNNTRVIDDDEARAAALWERLSPIIPRSRGAWTAVGLNERFRFYRYEVGQRFAWHRDGPFERHSGDRSQLTLMIYLNEDFEGGATEFDLFKPLAVRPQTGMALLFHHPVRHQGAPVRSGIKYVLRTDVMYRRSQR